MLQNLHDTITDKMQQKHHMNLQERRQGFTDNHDTVYAELEYQLSSRNSGRAAIWEQTLVNNNAGYLEHH